MDTINFGNTGLRVSRMAIGTGSHGWAGRSEQTALGLDGLANLLRRAYDLGVTFWDTADQYGSHPHVARALKDLPREKVTIATKTTARSGPQITKDVDRFLKELGTDVLDVVLLHGLSQDNWPKQFAGAMEALSQAKAAGKVRAVGMSCHGFGALKAAAASPWVEVVLVRINHAGVNMDDTPAKVVPVIKQLHDAGKGVYAMKVLGCGKLLRDVRGEMDYVLKLGTVHSLSIGISSIAHLEQDVRVMEELTAQV